MILILFIRHVCEYTTKSYSLTVCKLYLNRAVKNYFQKHLCGKEFAHVQILWQWTSWERGADTQKSEEF